LTTRQALPASSRLLSLAAAVGSIALLAVVIFTLWPADPSDTATADRDQVEGETIGWISKVEANTIYVNSGPFGGGVLPLLVTRNTRIMVGSKEGWFEDIRPGGQVKVVYQIAHGKRLARTVELLVDEGPRRPARAEPRVKSTSGSAAGGDAAGERIPTKPALVSSPPLAEPKTLEVPAAKPPVPAPPPAPTAPIKPAASTPPEARPAARPEPARAQATEPALSRPAATSGRGNGSADNGGRSPDAARPSQAATSATPAAPAATRPADPARASEGESTDGAAAVDWLLKGRR
jgi:hypothetical protein